MTKYKYTDELLRALVPNCLSFSDLARKLNAPLHGSTLDLLKRRVKRALIDTSHFPGRHWSKGKVGNKRRTAKDLLIEHTAGSHRVRAVQLRRALIEIGIHEKCAECGIPPHWNGKDLTLQVDHINGKYLDCRRENLRFICPNCHTQTPNYGVKNIGRGIQ